MNVENQLIMDKFRLRWYQKEIWDAINEKHYRKAIVILPRRAGKDISLWNLAIRYCWKKPCLVYYCLPTYSHARKAIWDAISIDSVKFLDYIPPALIDKVNQQEMKIVFKNGSILQCIGAESHNSSIRGTNPSMVILSEFAYMDNGDEVFNTISPIIAANKGIIIAASTPFGKNAFWHMYQIAKELPDWFVYLKTIEDTQHIDEEELEAERKRMSPELFAQEYMCSFERGVSGAVFGTCLNDLKKRGQITSVSYEPGLLVHCAIDIGVKDATTIIWFQVVGEGTVIRIIDCYSNTGLGLDHYVEVMQKKPYWGRMGKFFAPHDLAVREWGGGAITRYEKARQLGINFTILEQISIEDSIENTMTHFPKFWIDAERCKSLVDAIENYYKEWDEKRQVYKSKPIHNWASNYCDALRYMCQAIHKTKKGMTSEEFERKKAQALYGSTNDLPRFFRNDQYNRR